MADPSRWSELDQILTGPSSPLAFRALFSLLDTWEPGDQQDAIAAAARGLSRWPDRSRVAPWSAVMALAQGDVSPAWALVRRLELDGWHPDLLTQLRSDDLSIPFSAIAGHTALAGITELHLPEYDDTALEALQEVADRWPDLAVLRVWDRGSPRLQELAGLPLWGRLRELHVGNATERWESSRVPCFVAELPAVGPALASVTLHARDLMALWDRADLPALRSAVLYITSAEEAALLAGRAELAGLRDLTLAFRCGRSGRSGDGPDPYLGTVIPEDDEAARAFFSSARLRALDRLAVVGSRPSSTRMGMGPDGLQALIQSGLARQLLSLRLEQLPLGSTGVTALAQVLPPRGLERLELVDIGCGSEGAAALAQSSGVRDLELLDLSGNDIGGDGACLLAAAAMPRLRTLDLSSLQYNPYYDQEAQEITDRGAAAWAASPNAGTLRELRLRGACLTDAALEALAASERLEHLTHLDLSHNLFSAGGIGALASSRFWKTLQRLDLSDTRIDDRAVSQLVRVPSAPRLRSLRLAYNSIGPEGARALAAWPVVAGLWELHLHDNGIGDPGVTTLAASPYTGRLLELDLEQDCWNSRPVQYGLEAAAALADPSSFPRMDRFHTGIVDQHCGAHLSTGFSRNAWELLTGAAHRRPEVRASIQLIAANVDEEPEEEVETPSWYSPERLEQIRRTNDFRNGAEFSALGSAPDPPPEVWDRLVGTLGLESAEPGQRWLAPAGLPPYAGVVKWFKPHGRWTFRIDLDAPATGEMEVCLRAAAGHTNLTLSIDLDDDHAAALIAQDAEPWRQWMRESFGAYR